MLVADLDGGKDELVVVAPGWVEAWRAGSVSDPRKPLWRWCLPGQASAVAAGGLERPVLLMLMKCGFPLFSPVLRDQRHRRRAAPQLPGRGAGRRRRRED
jgi:hypothetical protein